MTPSKSADVQAAPVRCSAELSRRRRRDVDGDDEDAEYRPRPRSKRQKATSNASDDALTVLEPQSPGSEVGASPTRTCGTAADGECPVCFTILSHIADGSLAARESHVQACINSKLSSSPSAATSEARDSNTVLPNWRKGKRPVPATLAAASPSNQLSVPDSPPGDLEHQDLIDNAQDYMRRLSPDASDQNPRPSPNQGVDDAERSLPSPASDPAPLESIIPEPLTSAWQMPKPRALSPVWLDDTSERREISERTRQAQSRPGPKPEIHYYIIACRSPRLSKIHWSQGSLADITVNSLFNEVLDVASKRNVQRIAFKLTTSTSDTQYTITRNDDKIYEIMKKAFSKDINADLARGNMEFDIELELDPGQSGSLIAAEENGVDFGFSF